MSQSFYAPPLPSSQFCPFIPSYFLPCPFLLISLSMPSSYPLSHLPTPPLARTHPSPHSPPPRPRQERNVGCRCSTGNITHVPPPLASQYSGARPPVLSSLTRTRLLTHSHTHTPLELAFSSLQTPCCSSVCVTFCVCECVVFSGLSKRYSIFLCLQDRDWFLVAGGSRGSVDLHPCLLASRFGYVL